MTYWFHRNTLKATSTIKFTIPVQVAKANSIQICEELKNFRLEFLEALRNPLSGLASIEKCFNNYISLILGFISEELGQDENGNKLRDFIEFRWTQSLLGSEPIVYRDAVFEIISFCQEYAIWLMKHSSALASKTDLKEDEAKIVYKSLKKAASLFKFIEDNFFNLIQINKPVPGSDLDLKVSNVYIQQCLAEAQEVTISRAIELKHSPVLISALCIQTSKIFFNAACTLKQLESKITGKWFKYLNLKSSFYEAYAYNYNGENLLLLEKCGEAVKSLIECEKVINLTLKLCSEYVKAKGVGQSINPINHESFKKMISVCKRTKEKCELENAMIFHQKVSEEPIVLSDKATHGLVSIDVFDFPKISPLWSKEVYNSFDVTKKNKKDKSKKIQKLSSVKEKDVKEIKKK